MLDSIPRTSETHLFTRGQSTLPPEDPLGTVATREVNCQYDWGEHSLCVIIRALSHILNIFLKEIFICILILTVELKGGGAISWPLPSRITPMAPPIGHGVMCPSQGLCPHCIPPPPQSAPLQMSKVYKNNAHEQHFNPQNIPLPFSPLPHFWNPGGATWYPSWQNTDYTYLQ